MPATIRALAQGVDIHDGRLRAATLDRAHHTLTLSMRCGDNQVGYFELDLTDAGAWLHRMTFWRDYEVAVSFGRLALRLQPMPNRDFLRLPDVYVEVPSDAV